MIIRATSVKHAAMDDTGSPADKAEVLALIDTCLAR